MGKYVKTTKGIYELTPNRKIIDYKRLDLQSCKTINAKRLVDLDVDQDTWENGYPLGEVIKSSDNADDLISEIVAIDNKNRKVRIAKFQIKRYAIEFGDRIIALSWIGDDLLKTFEWDREKGDWKLYER